MSIIYGNMVGGTAGSDVIVDTTLSVEGHAADAKATGDAISALSEEITAIPSGKDGVGIESVVQTTTSTEDGGTNVVTVTKTDGTSSVFSVKNGSKGSPGEKGTNGKSAYAYAVEGGYDGTEKEFANKLAAGLFLVTVTDNNGTLTADKTYYEIATAILAGTTVIVDYDGAYLPLIGITSDSVFFGTIECAEDYVGTLVIEITQNDEVNDISAVIEKLPNPNALTFTGAVTGSYDGSAPLSVKIPSAVTDAHINELINTALNAIGVAEEGAY